MAKYDFYCSACNRTEELTCPMAERQSQVCSNCGGKSEQLFSPPTVFRIPESFRHSFSELFGTTSEKDFLKENPDLIPTREAEHIERPKDRVRRKKAEADKTVAEIERAIQANRTLVGDSGTRVDIVSQKTVQERNKEKQNAA